jgi:hypothetical protein
MAVDETVNVCGVSVFLYQAQQGDPLAAGAVNNRGIHGPFSVQISCKKKKTRSNAR